jgi:hypothetical protein
MPSIHDQYRECATYAKDKLIFLYSKLNGLRQFAAHKCYEYLKNILLTRLSIYHTFVDFETELSDEIPVSKFDVENYENLILAQIKYLKKLTKCTFCRKSLHNDPQDNKMRTIRNSCGCHAHVRCYDTHIKTQKDAGEIPTWICSRNHLPSVK